ncbi:MAG: hypothetical protein HQL06_14005 [Nitrospirae bacterium]|nr:hypothetical protein [Nitrospirota bacterium]
MVDIETLEKSVSLIGQSGLSFDTSELEKIEKINEGFITTTAIKPPVHYRSELRKIKNKINASLAKYDHMPELTQRELRILAYDHDLPVNNKSIYKKLLEEIRTANVSSSLIYRNLLFVYFKKYKYFIENQDIFNLLRDLWLLWGKNSIHANDLSDIVEAEDKYFSTYAPTKIAKCILDSKEIDSRQSIDALLSKHHLLLGTDDLLAETYTCVINLCLNGFRNRLYINVLLYEILPGNFVDEAQTQHIVSELIRLLDSDVDCRHIEGKNIERYFLKHDRFGDPRKIRNIDNWNGIKAQSVRIFKSWLAEDDITFFFKFLSDDGSDSYGRWALWLNLTDSIINSRIFISKYHYNNRREVIKQAKGDGKDFSFLYCNSGSLNSSCIVIDLDNLYAIEFTEPDTALYLYKKNTFNIDLTQDELNITDIKKIETPAATKDSKILQFYYTNYNSLRFHHNDNWQYLVEKYLAFYNIRTKERRGISHPQT